MPYAYYSNTTKGFYVTELNYPRYPDDVIAITQEQHEYFLNEINGNNKTIVVTNGDIGLVEKPPPIIDWDAIRYKRNRLLLQSDHTQLPDFPEAKKSQWATYRQELRDIPQTYATPSDVIWPTPPT
jgi:hypothetical protein